jgi:hypothetical protein
MIKIVKVIATVLWFVLYGYICVWSTLNYEFAWKGFGIIMLGALVGSIIIHIIWRKKNGMGRVTKTTY